MKKGIVFVFATVLSFKLLAISEENYKKDYDLLVRPFNHEMQDGWFKSKSKFNSKTHEIDIHYKTYFQENAKNCLVVLPGRSESAEKYAEFIFDLKSTSFGQNLNFFVLDHRGQGSSGRMTRKLDMGYVDRFENYQTDLDYFVNSVVLKKNCEKKFLFAHSMGAGIALSYLVSHQAIFDAVAVSSPMLQIQTRPYSYGVAQAIVRTQVAIGRGDEFAIGQSGYSSHDQFEDNRFTTSKARFDMAMNTFEEFPQTKLGGVSNRWVYEIMRGTAKLRTQYSNVSMPLKVFIAGTELYSEPSEMHKLCATAPDCQEVFFPTSKHEILNDRDENRDKAMEEMISLFESV